MGKIAILFAICVHLHITDAFICPWSETVEMQDVCLDGELHDTGSENAVCLIIWGRAMDWDCLTRMSQLKLVVCHNKLETCRGTRPRSDVEIACVCPSDEAASPSSGRPARRNSSDDDDQEQKLDETRRRDLEKEAELIRGNEAIGFESMNQLQSNTTYVDDPEDKDLEQNRLTAFFWFWAIGFAIGILMVIIATIIVWCLHRRGSSDAASIDGEVGTAGTFSQSRAHYSLSAPLMDRTA